MMLYAKSAKDFPSCLSCYRSPCAEAASIIAENTSNPPLLPTLRPRNSFLSCTFGLSLISIRQSASLTSFLQHQAIKWTAVHCLTTLAGVAVLGEDAGRRRPFITGAPCLDSLSAPFHGVYATAVGQTPPLQTNQSNLICECLRSPGPPLNFCPWLQRVIWNQPLSGRGRYDLWAGMSYCKR